MDKLINTLPVIVKAAGASAEVVEAACIAAWKDAAGTGLRDHTLPMSFNNGTLVVAVADSTWQQQMRSLNNQLLRRLNSLLGQPLVEQIDYRVMPERLPVDQGSRAKCSSQEPVDRATIPIELLSASALIQDKDLRRAFLGAALSCIERLEKDADK